VGKTAPTLILVVLAGCVAGDSVGGLWGRLGVPLDGLQRDSGESSLSCWRVVGVLAGAQFTENIGPAKLCSAA